MKTFTLLVIFIIFAIYTNAQVISFKNLFQDKKTLQRDFHGISSGYQSLRLNAQNLTSARTIAPQKIALSLPFEKAALDLDLNPVKITSPRFTVIEASANGAIRNVSYTVPSFYQGKIKGKEKSFATLSLFDKQVIGIMSDEKSNIVLGAIEQNGRATDEYALYRDIDLKTKPVTNCYTSETPADSGLTAQAMPSANARVLATGQPIEIYFECDYKFYTDKGSSVTNVVNYVLSFFNSVALLYANEDIQVQVSQIKVWTTPDPYTALTTTSTILNAFSSNMATDPYVGDYAHFLSTRSLGGGVAWLLNNPCLSSRSQHSAVSAVDNTYKSFPTYSWTVEVVTHELGHNFGSNHTHWCGWPGGPIDGCGPTANVGYQEGTCAVGPLPPKNGGTIMSYCHLLGSTVGISLSNGFGPLPGDKIRTILGAASCYGTCKMTVSLASIDASCSQSNGSITATPANGTGAYSYLWSNGQTGATLTNAAPGTYTVTATDASGCKVMAIDTLVNSGSTLSFTLTPSGTASYCSGNSITLSATNNAGYTYQWSNNGTPISGAVLSTYIANAAGNYAVLVTSGSCSGTKSVVVTQVAQPTATISYTGALIFCSGNNVVLNANPSTGYQYQWYNNGSAISGATSNTYTATLTGNYTVRVYAGTCESTSSAVTVTVVTTPVATITAGGPLSFCTGNNVKLNASPATGYQYQWYNNSSAISGATTNSYMAATTGNYTVRAYSGSCESTSAAVTVTAVTTPVATITAGGPLNFCSGNNVVLNASPSTGYQYQWYNNGSPINGATNNTYTATASANYTVRVYAGSCESTSSAVSVTVVSTPAAIITAGGPLTFCTGNNVKLNAAPSTGYQYQWYNNGSAISGAINNNYTATTSGNYTVRVYSGSCGTTSAAVAVTAVSTPVATITAGGPVNFCTGNNVVLNASPSTGYQYQWYNNGSAISGAINNNYTANTNGNYTVRVYVGSCEATSSAVSVSVVTAPVATITAGGPLSICDGKNVQLIANTGTNYGYQWYRNNVIITGATQATYSATSGGNYTVVTSLGTCTKTSAGTAITILPSPVLRIDPDSSVIEKYHTQTLTASGAASYNWNAQPALVSSAANTSTVEPLTTTIYTVEGTDNNGCTSSVTAKVIVIGCGDAESLTATVYSPSRVLLKWANPAGTSGDSVQYRLKGSESWVTAFTNTTEYEINGLTPGSEYEYRIMPVCTTTDIFIASAIENFTTTQLYSDVYLKLYPNPVSSSGKVEIIVDKPFTLQIETYNKLGQKVIAGNAENLPAGQVIKTINASRLSSGIYHLAVRINDKLYTMNMVVQH